MNPPMNAAEAAGQIDKIWGELSKARANEKTHGNCHVRLAHLYDDVAKPRATMNPDLDDLTVDKRAAAVKVSALSQDVRVEAVKIAETVGLAGLTMETVGDLRWLRNRSEQLASWWSAKAYDERARISAWQTVASMAKSEAELAPPHERGAAA